MEKPLNLNHTQHLRISQKNTQTVSERYWWKVVALCFLGWVLIYADRTILNPVMPKIAATFGINDAQLGLISSVFFLTYALAQIPFGILADKIGRRTVIIFGFILFSAMTFVSGLVATFGIFLVIRAIAGLGEGAYYGPQYALSGEAIPLSKLTLGTAIINSGMAFGSSGGYILSSYLVLQHHQSWTLPFFIISIPTFIIGLLFFFLKEHVKPQNQKNALQGGDIDSKNQHQLRAIFTNKDLVLAFSLCFCSIYAYFVVLTWLPQFLQVERGFSGASVGYISSLVPWASIPGALVFARLYDKFSHPKTLVWILVPIAVVSLITVGFTTNRTILMIALVTYGLTGKLAIDPIILAFVTRRAGNTKLSTTLSAYNFIGMSGSILAPYITGWLSDTVGTMTIGFYLGASLLVIGALGFLFTNTQQSKID